MMDPRAVPAVPSPTMADTRRDKRAPVSLKVRFKSATIDEFVEQYSSDISRGGLFIKSKKPMKVGTLLKFELQLKDESRLIHGVGRVVWRREGEEATEQAPAGMGIKFIKMGGDSRTMVQQIIETRGDDPGTFDAGAEGPKSEESFFPDSGPAELPNPEDRTQVRHASEFLAEALSEVDGGAAAEAEADAEAARKRTEEIQKERAAAEERRKADEATAAARIREQEDAAKAAAAEAKARAEAEAEAAAAAAEEAESSPHDEVTVVAPATVPDRSTEKSALGAAATVPAGVPLGGADDDADEKDLAAATVRDEPRKLSTDIDTERPPAPAGEGGSPWLVVAIVVLVVGAVGGYLWWTGQQQPGAEDELATDFLDPEHEPAAEEEEALAEAEEVDEELVMTTVAVSANVPATVLVDGNEVGTAPTEVQLPIGEEALVEVRAAGYGSRTQTVTAAEGQEPVSFELEALPWVVAVQTEPAGARISVAGRNALSPSRIELGAAVEETLTVAASKAGYRMTTSTLEPSDFREQQGAMVASLTIALEERAAPEPATMAPTMAAVMEPTPATMEAPEPAPTMEPTPATMEPAPAPTMEPTPATMEPAPAPTMETVMEAAPATMDTPDNPF